MKTRLRVLGEAEPIVRTELRVNPERSRGEAGDWSLSAVQC